MITVEWHRSQKCYVLTCSPLLPQSWEKVFAFFSDAFQLERIFEYRCQRMLEIFREPPWQLIAGVPC